MPHVIVCNPPNPADFYRSFRRWKKTLKDGTILEARSAYLRSDGKAVLIHGFCLELGPPTHFFVSIEAKKRQVTVRLYPHPSPPRSPGVQSVVAQVAKDLLRLGGQVERTNLKL
ncbi:MAG: hypothetical protein V3T77_03310 [Planctomycetota bacterium]